MKFYSFRVEKGRVGDELKDFFFFFLSSLDFYTTFL